MSRSPAAARILIATDNAADGRLVERQLTDVFATLRISLAGDRAAADFDAFDPEVLVLAFDTLEKSERYYLGLYRLSAGAIRGRHRTVVLCAKADVRAAFDLCRKDYFDDYALFWPQSFDGLRLAMSVWAAARPQAAAADPRPNVAQLLLHARHLADLEHAVAEPAPAPDAGWRHRVEPALAGTRPLAAAARSLKPLVLVIDDDEFAQKLVQHSLDPVRWDVAFAADGSTALAQLRRGRVDLILMDVRMPGMDGVTLTRLIKATPELAHIPVLMMTGDARRETLMGSVEAGASGFVVKPVTRAALEAQLEKVLPR